MVGFGNRRGCKQCTTWTFAPNHQFKAIQAFLNCTHPLSKKYEKCCCLSVLLRNSIILKFYSSYISKAHTFFLQSFLSFNAIIWFPLATATHTKSWFKKVICYPLGLPPPFFFLQSVSFYLPKSDRILYIYPYFLFNEFP